jgi:hypothetical protein
MPPLADLFALFGGLGEAEAPPQHGFDEVQGSEGIDSLLMMVILLLLKKENADQGLLLALLYIMI